MFNLEIHIITKIIDYFAHQKWNLYDYYEGMTVLLTNSDSNLEEVPKINPYI